MNLGGGTFFHRMGGRNPDISCTQYYITLGQMFMSRAIYRLPAGIPISWTREDTVKSSLSFLFW